MEKLLATLISIRSIKFTDNDNSLLLTEPQQKRPASFLELDSQQLITKAIITNHIVTQEHSTIFCFVRDYDLSCE